MNSQAPAFPTISCDESSLSNGGSYTDHSGLTMRDYFAAKAMAVIIPTYDAGQAGKDIQMSIDIAAHRAYRWADAMLKARDHATA